MVTLGLDYFSERGDWARTHEECRQLIYTICSKKVKSTKGHSAITVLSERYEKIIKDFIIPDFSLGDDFYPTALCDTCRLGLVALEKVTEHILFTCNFNQPHNLGS